MESRQQRADLVAAYDAHADDRDANGEPSWRDAIRADFASRLEPGGRVLEIGAGVGYTARWFKDQGFEVMATDLSPANVEKCREKGVDAHVRDMADLRFAAERFDGVWAASCLMHIPNGEVSTVLAEVWRVLYPGGLFWSGTWGGTDQEGPWADDWYEPKRFYSIRNDARIQEMYQQFFDIVSFESLDPESKIAWHYQSTLMRKA